MEIEINSNGKMSRSSSKKKGDCEDIITVYKVLMIQRNHQP